MSVIRLWLHTLASLAAPRRALPVVLVTAPMIFVQHLLGGPVVNIVPALTMAATFALVAPFAWRWLRPWEGGALGGPLRLGLYASLGALPSACGWLAGEALDLSPTFVTARFNLVVTVGLFWVGGWGLARDIEREGELAATRARAEALAREAERAQLLALRAHLDPHFLFNTLNALAEWCREDGAVAERGLLELSEVLRELLGGLHAAAWPLTRELALARRVLDLHRLRDPDAFTLRWEVAPGDATVPPLLLLPLVENAVKHGPAKGHRGELAIVVTTEGRLCVRVENPGPFEGERDGGIGLGTVRRRLALAYGDARVDVGGATRTVARLDLPLHPTEAT